MTFPIGWPPRPSSGTRSLRFYRSGTGTANFTDNVFLFREANQALAMIGSRTDVNGQVFASVDAAGPDGNQYTIAVVIPLTGGPNALSASISGKDITVSLATDASNLPLAASNTATLVAAAVNGLAGVGAFANGTGASSLGVAEARKSFFFGGGAPVLPTPYLLHGQATVQTSVGTSLASGSPMGGGEYVGTESEPMNHSFSIRIVNTGGATLEISFDGVNIHGAVPSATSVIYERRHEAGMAIRGVSTYLVEAW